MMKKRTIFLTGLILIFLAGHLVFASTTQRAADLLVEVGERSLAGGDIQAAIHDFSKALMIVPDHRKARAYLKHYNLSGGLYSKERTREARLADLGRDIGNYKDDISLMQKDRHALRRRVMLLEDVIERKGDHKLLKDVEDYYRVSAFYEVDVTLPRDQQLAAYRRKHKDFQDMAFDKDRVQEKYLDVMEELLSYREEHLQDARNDLVDYRISLATNRKELLFRMDQVKRLSKEYDSYRQTRSYDVKEMEYLQNDLANANHQVNMLLDNRQILLHQLNSQLNTMKESL